jgi:hypothetical protein
MKRIIVTAILLLSAVLSAQAATHHSRSAAKPRSYPSVVTYNRDSPDPSVGWHSQGGVRVCTNDCDNPEIPGSGFTCKNVQVFGMAMRECDNSN